MCRIDYCEDSFVVVYFFPEIESSHLLTPVNCLSDATQKSDEHPRGIPQIVITRFLTTNVLLPKKSTKLRFQVSCAIFPNILVLLPISNYIAVEN